MQKNIILWFIIMLSSTLVYASDLKLPKVTEVTKKSNTAANLALSAEANGAVSLQNNSINNRYNNSSISRFLYNLFSRERKSSASEKKTASRPAPAPVVVAPAPVVVAPAPVAVAPAPVAVAPAPVSSSYLSLPGQSSWQKPVYGFLPTFGSKENSFAIDRSQRFAYVGSGWQQQTRSEIDFSPLTQIDLSTGARKQFPIFESQGHRFVAVSVGSSEHEVFALDSYSLTNSLVVLNTHTGAYSFVSGSITLGTGEKISRGQGPNISDMGGIAIDQRGEYAYVAEASGKSLLRVNLETGLREKFTDYIFAKIQSIKYVNGRIYLADSTNQLINEIDVQSKNLKSFKYSGVLSSAIVNSLSADSRSIFASYVQGYNRGVAKIDIATGEVSALVTKGKGLEQSGKVDLFTQIGIEAVGGKIFILDQAVDEIISLSSDGSSRAYVGRHEVGRGQHLVTPRFKVNSSGNIYALDTTLKALLEIDPITGDRKIIYGLGVGKNPPSKDKINTAPAPELRDPVNLAVDETYAYVLSTSYVDKIRLADGYRESLSSSQKGTGASLPNQLTDIEVQGTRILVSSEKEIIAIDKTTGNRTKIYGNSGDLFTSINSFCVSDRSIYIAGTSAGTSTGYGGLMRMNEDGKNQMFLTSFGRTSSGTNCVVNKNESELYSTSAGKYGAHYTVVSLPAGTASSGETFPLDSKAQTLFMPSNTQFAAGTNDRVVYYYDVTLNAIVRFNLDNKNMGAVLVSR